VRARPLRTIPDWPVGAGATNPDTHTGAGPTSPAPLGCTSVDSDISVAPVDAGNTEVQHLSDALTAELAGGGYTPEQTFGYSTEQLERRRVHLVGAKVAGRLVGIGGLELQDANTAELKRFYGRPGYRGRGVADALLAALVAYGQVHGAGLLRLETGDRQHAALRFYARHGFIEVPRFPPYVDSETSICMQRHV
jgi:putative acetyltransferase